MMNYSEAIEVIEKALLSVSKEYFRVKTTYDENGIIRERVFCYELYHQIRKIIGDTNELSLNGEIDKRGHKDFKKEDWRNPDFIFHSQGTHKNNTLICEVKGSIDGDIPKDFDTIHLYIEKYGYHAGIFILYNHTIDELLNSFSGMLNLYSRLAESNRIFIVCMPEPQSSPKRFQLNLLFS